MGGKGKGGKRHKRKINEDGQLSHNSFKILEEEVGNNGANQKSETKTNEKDKDTSMEDIPENSQQQDDPPSIMELSKDHEVTPSEAGMEDYEVQEILEKENLDLEKFLKQGITKGVDSLPKEELDRVQ